MLTIIDAWSIKTDGTDARSDVGFDAGKNVKVSKHRIVIDILSMVLKASDNLISEHPSFLKHSKEQI
ncbi:hypothetical protein [Nitrosomonas sp. Nm132]|uniref:hypothetical protein n=1 Tax=Nitrosomonas sp. Nm132 TaxID=1881053 RepID=UPI000B8170B3|nr:hypothetical protein [Nitrosomonas sp. Nm132]